MLCAQEGSKAIFHLEAFLARFMSNYKQVGWRLLHGHLLRVWDWLAGEAEWHGSARRDRDG